MKNSKILVISSFIVCLGISLIPLNTYADNADVKNVIVTNTSANPVPVSVTNTPPPAEPNREAFIIQMKGFTNIVTKVVLPKQAMIESMRASCTSPGFIWILTDEPGSATLTKLEGDGTANLSNSVFNVLYGETALPPTNVTIPIATYFKILGGANNPSSCDLSISVRYSP